MPNLDMWIGWLQLTGAALGIMTTLVAAVYALSELLMNDKMKQWAKVELAEIFYSAVIISFVVMGVGPIDQVVQSSLGVSGGIGGAAMTGCDHGPVTSTYVPITDLGTFIGARKYVCEDICGPEIAANTLSPYHGVDACHMRLGMWYMREVFEEGKKFAFDTYSSYIWTSIASEFTINIEFMFEKAGFFTFTPWRGAFTIPNKVNEMVFDWTIKIMMVDKFQEVFLHFIAIALFPSLLVSGAVLRTFAFTRKLGGLLLAMAIALYFIYPAFYAFGALILLNMKNDPVIIDAWLADTKANPEHTKDPFIIDTMYIHGAIPMPGATGGTMDSADMQNELNKIEGKPYNPSDPLLPPSDMSSNKFSNMTDGQKKDAMASMWDKAYTWFTAISSESKVDTPFIKFAWVKGGPVDIAARFTFWSMFFSLFGLLGTIAAIRSLSITFGGDIEIAGLTRLI
jgi:hypothetical protein